MTAMGQRRRAWPGLVVVGLLGLGACDGDPPDGQPRGDSAVVLDCVRDGFPCNWGDVDPAVVRRTDAVGQVAAALMGQARSTDAVASLLRSAPGVVEVQAGDLAVRFRLQGGRPAWVAVPGDPARPRMGGPVRRPPGASLPSARTGKPAGIAARQPGEGKRALVVSPFEWQWPGKTLGVVEELRDSRDYGKDDGGAVDYRANLAENARNPLGPLAPGDDSDAAQVLGHVGETVSLDDFRHWNRYNFVYLSTHGQAVCDGGRCYTLLLAGPDIDGATGLALAHPREPGLTPVYTTTNLHPGLTPAEAETCVREMQAGDGGVRTAPAPAGKPCLFTQDKGYADIALSTDFFRHAYPAGLENIVVFLAACQSLKSPDLAGHLLQGGAGRPNRNVAVLGYDEVVFSDAAAEIGALVADLMTSDAGPALDTQSIIDIVGGLERFASVPFSGIAQGAADLPGRPARFVERATNPTHARDIVELVDPATGVELADGASLATFGTAPGKRDGIRVGTRLRGVGDRGEADAVDLYLSVDGRQAGSAFRASRRVQDGVFEVEDRDIELGFDLGERTTVDLAIRAEWPGGESRWDYRDVRIGSGFTYRASGDLVLAGEGPVPGVVGVSRTTSDDCLLALPLHAPGSDHSLRLVARLPGGLREGRYRVAESYTGNPDTPFGSLDHDFERIWISGSTTGKRLTPGLFHAELGADKRYGTDDRGEDFVSRDGSVVVEAFDGKRLELAFSIDLVQVGPEGPVGTELTDDMERLLESGHPFGGPAAKEAGRQRVLDERAAFAANPARRSTRVTGRLSHVISGRMSPPDIYACKTPSP